ncbi:MAG: hypothetical protein CMP23_05610 [Rickettsiales bacterium]|nr:hypothetical protein [Rickettsiales bacterium]
MESQQGRKFLFTQLQEGIKRQHLLFFYFSALITIGLAVLMSVLQPFLLEAFLQIPRSEQGTVTGNAAVVAEIVILCLIGIWGAGSDKVGRRLVYAVGIAIVALAAALHPFVSEAAHLYLLRGLYAVGMAAATGMLATLAGDYVIKRDLGKANGLMGVCNAIGAALAATVLVKLPIRLRDSYVASGMEPSEAATAAGWKTYLIVGGLGLLCAALLRLGLAPKSTTQTVERIPFATRLKEGVAAGRRDRVTALSYVTAFVARADLAIAGLFIPLWCALYVQNNPKVLLANSKYQCGEGSAGPCVDASGAACAPGSEGCLLAEGSAEAMACMADGLCLSLAGMERAGLLIAMVGAGSLWAAPFIGILCDRINRVSAVAVGLMLNVIGYGLTFFVVDPFSTAMLFVAMTIGAGEVAGVISTQSLIQQQAPVRSRGAVIGFFGFCGGLGILVNSFIGGKLFDTVAFNAPFVWLAGLNLVVVVACILVRRSIGHGQDDDQLGNPTAAPGTRRSAAA